jgi:G3E family GTPase
MKTIPNNRRVMRTPVVLVCGQGDTDSVAGTLLGAPGTVVVGHDVDGHVVRRWVSTMRAGNLSSTELPLELAHGCISCTIRNDLLVLLRRLHRRNDVERIVVLVAPWLEPEPICWAINNIRVRVGAGYVDSPAARDVRIAAVVTCIDSVSWLGQALGDAELDDQRTVAQVVVGQAEFADVLVLTEAEPTTLAVLRRLAPRARITVGLRRVEMALRHLEPGARCGQDTSPHDPLLAGEPPLGADGEVSLLPFSARRPFHPQRLHAAIETLFDGVIRTRGRAWLATQPDVIMWIESAGGGLRLGHAGPWLAAMSSSQLGYTDPERRALAALYWDDRFGDRHTSMTILVCGARPTAISEALQRALLTDDEMSRPTEWSRYLDPFGVWHKDPCEDLSDGNGLPVHGSHEGDER